MKRIEAQSIASVLEEFFDANPKVADRLGESRAIEAWYKLIGASAAKFTSSVQIRKRVLYVKLTSSVLKSELSMCRENLIQRLNEKAGRNVVDNIVFT
ncbi:MAG: DUF721 domain-containing protein [Dysgonamonadaceae bacterium]|jgi:predicted nucleic acid-binding Zn ribbon protein|nr:DUF721 domain-containing protein [Dysgonamonadaceae bacterium]